MREGNREAIARLDAYLDAVATGQPVPREVDPALPAIDHQLRVLDRAPEPSPEFAAHLFAEITGDQTRSGPSSRWPDLGRPPSPNGRYQSIAVPQRKPRPARQRGPLTLVTPFVTAALLLITLVAGLLAAGLLRPLRDGGQLVVLPAIATPAPGSPVEFVWATSGGPGLPLEDPFRLAIDRKGNLWVTDGKNSRFQIFAPDGTFLEAWGEPGDGPGQFNFTEPGLFGGYGAGAVAFDADGNIFVADMGNQRIQKFAPDRRFLTDWGTFGFEDGEFYGMSDLVIDAQGHVYVADYMQSTIQVFDNDGTFLQSWSQAEGEPPLNPEGLGIDADGNIWVAEYAQNRIRKLAPDGSRLSVWGERGLDDGLLSSPYDVAVDGQGRVFVAEDGADRVKIFDEAGNSLGGWGESGKEDGQFDGPAGLVLDGQGYIYVTDSLSHRVQKFRLLPPFDGGS